MDDRAAVITTVVVTVGSLIVALLTRRSAKETTVTSGFSQLLTIQQTELKRQGDSIAELQHMEANRRRLARQHEIWDRQVVKQLRSLTDDPIPDPPPLDEWE